MCLKWHVPVFRVSKGLTDMLFLPTPVAGPPLCKLGQCHLPARNRGSPSPRTWTQPAWQLCTFRRCANQECYLSLSVSFTVFLKNVSRSSLPESPHHTCPSGPSSPGRGSWDWPRTSSLIPRGSRGVSCVVVYSPWLVCSVVYCSP